MRLFAGLAILVGAWSAPALAEFEQLLGAARTGDFAAVEALLAAGEDPDPPEYHHGYSPLQFAAGNGDAVMTRALLAAGAGTEYRDHNGDRALLWAAYSGTAETVRLLLDAGSPPDSPADPYGKTPTMTAAQYDHLDMVQALLAAGADPNRYDQSGDTAPHFAARTDDVQLVKELLAAGANPNVIDEILLETPLDQAAVWSTPDVVQLLIAAGAALEGRDSDGHTALYNAAMVGQYANVKALLLAGARADAPDMGGQLPIEAAFGNAATYGTGAAGVLAEWTEHLDRAFVAAIAADAAPIALRLMARGASPNAVDADGRSALAASVRVGGSLLFTTLLERGADLTKFGAQTLLAAAEFGRTDLVQLLLERHVPVDSRDPRGATPLLLAAKNAHPETVELLLASGAERDPHDDFGLGLSDYMDIVPGLYEARIEFREQSRAWRPTEELEIDLGHIRERRALIREMLAE
jgi:ankyrin repeat protein